MRLLLKNTLQKNAVFNKIYIKIVPFIIKCFGMLLVKNPRKIVFSSFSGRSFNDSPKKIYDLIKKDPFFRRYRFVWAFDEPERYKDPVENV